MVTQNVLRTREGKTGYVRLRQPDQITDCTPHVHTYFWGSNVSTMERVVYLWKMNDRQMGWPIPHHNAAVQLDKDDEPDSNQYIRGTLHHYQTWN